MTTNEADTHKSANPEALTRLQRKLAREIKARQQAEQHLEEKSTQLYNANEKLQLEVKQVKILSQSVDATRDGVALLDSSGFVTYCNPAFSTIFG